MHYIVLAKYLLACAPMLFRLFWCFVSWGVSTLCNPDTSPLFPGNMAFGSINPLSILPRSLVKLTQLNERICLVLCVLYSLHVVQ